MCGTALPQGKLQRLHCSTPWLAALTSAPVELTGPNGHHASHAASNSCLRCHCQTVVRGSICTSRARRPMRPLRDLIELHTYHARHDATVAGRCSTLDPIIATLHGAIGLWARAIRTLYIHGTARIRGTRAVGQRQAGSGICYGWALPFYRLQVL